MSRGQLNEMRLGVASQVDRVVGMAARATLGPMLLRLAVALAAIAGFAMAYAPVTFTNPAATGLVLVAVAPGLFPRGPWPTLSIAMIVGGYLLATSFEGVPVSMWRIVGVAGAIYLVHSGAAFASVLPYDSVVSRGLFVGWMLRVAAVVALTVLVAVFVAALPSFVGGHRLVIASVAGFLVVLAIALYLLYLWQRGES